MFVGATHWPCTMSSVISSMALRIRCLRPQSQSRSLTGIAATVGNTRRLAPAGARARTRTRTANYAKCPHSPRVNTPSLSFTSYSSGDLTKKVSQKFLAGETRSRAHAPATPAPRLGDIVDLTAYPVHAAAPDARGNATSAALALARDTLIARCRRDLDEVGCCVIKDFITPASIARMRTECASMEGDVHWPVNHAS